jgi:acetyl esterase/lipase
MRKLLVAMGLVLSIGVAGPINSTAAGATRYLDPVFSDVTVKQDLVYGQSRTQSGELVQLKLDLYQPAGDSERRRPVIIWAHGGGFVTGDKRWPADVAVVEDFTRRGWVVASINYRLRTSVSTADNLAAARDGQHDMQAAVRWVRRYATHYRVNADAIVVAGVSAGGIVALHTNFNPGDAGLSGNPGYPSNVAAGVAVSAAALDPVIIGPKEPPIAMFHAADDTVVPMALATETCAATTALLNTCAFFTYLRGGHPPAFLEANREIIVERSSAFICREVAGACGV